MKKVLIGVLAVVILGVVGFAANGKIAPLSWGLWGDVNLESGVASRGYDVVSYHTSGNAVIGVQQYNSVFNGAEWRFSTEENKKLFDANPERYMPMYGGFCAYAVYNNITANVNPQIWHIENGKLYLFASESTKQDWVAEISKNSIGVTDRNWADR